MNASRKKENILVVDDAPDTLEVLQRNLTSRYDRVFTASSVAEAIRLLSQTPVDLVITDLKMPGASGLDLVRHVRENFKDMEVMMITGYPTIETAVQAVKTGEEEYLSKPFTEEELFAAVERVLVKLRLRRTSHVSVQGTIPSSFGLIGQSEALDGILSLIGKAASTSATVLLIGESGTGKELIAR